MAIPDAQADVLRYSRFALLTDPARPSAALWRLALGLVVVFAVTVGLSRGMVAMVEGLASPQAGARFIDSLTHADDPLGVLALLGLTGALGLATLVVAETMHWRSFESLLGPWPMVWRQALRVAVSLALLHGAVALLPPWPLREASVPGLDPGLWLALLPLTLLTLLVQTASEELFFRGYLQSQLGARLRSPLVWLVVPSALFALGHYAPGHYGGNAVTIALWSFFFGLAAADLTARAGTLGPAIALHMVNNTMAVAVVSLSSDMSGLALRLYPFDVGNEAALAALLPADLAFIGLSWLTARIALRR